MFHGAQRCEEEFLVNMRMLAKERGDNDFVGFFGEANALYRNFYEDEMEKESVEILAGRIEQLITKLKEFE